MPLTLHDVLDLREVATDSFQAPAAVGGDRLYGGYLLGQAFVAAMRTVPGDRPANSIHASFLRAGVPDVDVTLDVPRVRDGGSFSSRQVVMHQAGRELLRATVSMHTGEDGDDWQAPHPAPAAPPEDCYEIAPERRFPIMDDFELRTVHEWDGRRRLHPYWIRLARPVGDEPYLQHAALLTISDLTVIRTARHVDVPGLEHAAMSLDHTLWFHRAPRMDDWVYVDVVPTSNAQSRALTQGRISDADGRLLASMNQEVLLRMPRGFTPEGDDAEVAD
ncbi:acyl-CoA thioesterase [Cumulibacter manganitolerans]|uniref:acyl-CoA thioesterase n=1 Tax=Cumulibacter manganitolerans TaxID=1884992 RepID=UPI001297F6CC|nr:acyl-CoA thioesterase domain-containing protein [Cumulibacter manganitolerans]